MHFSELACTSGLFFMTIICTCGFCDGLSIWNFRFFKYDGQFVVVLYPPFECTEVEFALTGENGLLQLFALLNFPCRVFFVHTVKNDRQLFSITLGYRPYGALIFRSRIFNEIIESYLTAFFIKGVATTYIFQLHCSTYVAGTQFVDRGFHLATDAIKLGETFFTSSGNIVEIGSCIERARHNLEVLHFTDMGLNSGFKHEYAQRTVAVGFHFVARVVDRRRHVIDEWHNVAKEFHHTAHTHIL